MPKASHKPHPSVLVEQLTSDRFLLTYYIQGDKVTIKTKDSDLTLELARALNACANAIKAAAQAATLRAEAKEAAAARKIHFAIASRHNVLFAEKMDSLVDKSKLRTGRPKAAPRSATATLEANIPATPMSEIGNYADYL